ncbi:molybdate-anion transporter MOT2, partial [Blastocladiella britannica]
YSAFRRNYLAVYLLVNASDWLCGPYLYSVYKEHGMDLATISTLSVVGFLSSAVLGSYLGSLSDRWGRRKLCLLYPVAFALNSLLIQVPNFYLLLLGRVFGGIATSLLFSVFEAWMTSEYFASGFPGGDALGSLFSTAVTLNSVVAIAAGLIANYAVDVTATTRAPFLIALIPAFAGSAIVALTWSENYGESSASTTSSSGPPNGGLIAAIRQEPAIALVGAVQACFEGAMYGFVCLFGPSLDELAGT